MNDHHNSEDTKNPITNKHSSIINILEMIDANYDVDTAADLQKRIMLSIKNRDPERFNRAVKRIRGPR